MAVDQHYENFPVASALLPPAIRPFVVAIYRFARHADDVADEGDAAAAERLTVLARLDREVRALFAGTPAADLSLPTVRGLHGLRASYPEIAVEPFTDLLSAFAQDVATNRYDDFPQLLDYCRRSANPVGRLMLALIRVNDAPALHAWYKRHLGIDVQVWGGAAFSWTDDDGKPVGGTTVWSINPDGTVTYTYDALGQLLSATYSNDSIADESYAYDANGNLTAAPGLAKTRDSKLKHGL